MAKNRHIPHAAAGKKSPSLRAVVLTAALLACVTAAVQPAQAQTPSPSATYTLNDRYAYEPSSSSAGDADTGTFTITLSNLNASQMDLPRRRFHFNLEALSNNHPDYPTPGYDSAASGIDANNLASHSDFTLSVEFRSGFTPHSLVTESLEFDMPTNTITASHVKAEGGGTEVYTFRVTPTHDDNNDEGMQPLLFGYRVNFVDGAAQDVAGLRLTGMVNGAPNVPAMIIADAPSAMLTRDHNSIEEGVSTPGVFTLVLDNVPDGSAIVTYTLAVSGDSPDSGDISATFGGAAAGTPVIGSNATFTITASDGGGTATLAITPETDGDMDNETVTLTIASIEIAGLSFGPTDLMCNDCSPPGALEITVIDADAPDPSATYALTTPHAFEPTGNGAGDEVAAVFTLTLSNLNTTQRGASNLDFLFRLAGSEHLGTPGYGTRDASVTNPTLATINSAGADFEFILNYTGVDNDPVTRMFRNDSGVYSTGNVAGQNVPRAMDDVYTVRVVPLHDTLNNEGVEFLLFGLRVDFIGADDSHDLEVVVNGGEGDPALTISDPLVARLTRSDSPTEEGDSPTPAVFTFTLENAPSGPATVTYTLEVSGITPDNGDISAAFGDGITGTPVIGGGGGTFTINISGDTAATLNITPVNDNDMDNEFVTLTITGIEVAGLSLGPADLTCSNCDPLGALEITVIDADAPDPSATYALTTPHAFEPTSNGADDEVDAVFTLTLSNLNQAQRGAAMRRFYFVFTSGSIGSTPGYQAEDPSIEPLTIARANSGSNDFILMLEYTNMSGQNVEGDLTPIRGAVQDIIINSPARPESGEEVYTFRVVPQYNRMSGDGSPVALDEGVEILPFGYRVVFPGAGSENEFEGRVNGGEGDPVPTISDPLVARLTRSNTPTEEGGSPTPAVFTLTLENTPSGPAVVTYTLEVSGTTPDNGDISAAFGSNITETTPVVVGDGSDTFTINVNINVSSDDTAATLAITPVSDTDTDNETVTLTIISIEVAGLSLGPTDLTCSNCNPVGALDITVTDDLFADPSATYDLTTPHAFEPTSGSASDEVEAVFTLTLSNLNQAQSNSSHRQFFFAFTGGGTSLTPGYNPLDDSISSLTIARQNNLNDDFQFILEYMNMSDELATVMLDLAGGTLRTNSPISRARRDSGEEVYTFSVVPQYDPTTGGMDNDGVEGVESLPFGYRVFFSGQGNSNALEGQVNGGEGDPVPTISDPLVATLTRDDTPTEEGDSPTPATFTLMLENAPSGPAVVTYTLEVSGDTPANDDISAAFGSNITETIPVIGGDGSDTFTINVNISNSGDDTAATLAITPVSDDDADNEIVTLTITGIEVAGLSLGPGNLVCSNCNPDGALIITVMDDDAIPEPPSEIPLRVNGAGDPPEIQLNTAGQTNIVVELESGTAAEDINLAWRVEPKYTDIATGGDTSCGVLTDNSVACWGNTNDGQATSPAGVEFSSISVGHRFVCGIRLDNELVECWGDSANGKTNPGASANLVAANDLPRTKLIASGQDYTCAVAVEADAAKVSGSRWYCWGNVSSSGIDRTTNRPGSTVTFDEISGGRDHICGARTDAGNEGTLHCTGVGFGAGEQLRQFNNESAVDLAEAGSLGANARFKKAYAGVSGGSTNINGAGTYNSGHYTCVIFDDIDNTTSTSPSLEDQAYCWKQDSRQNFGGFEELIPHEPATHGTNTDKSFGHQHPDIVGKTFKSLAAGQYAVCGILLDADPDTGGNQMEDELFCWGEDTNSQVNGRPAGRFSKVASSREHFCAITARGQTECWGQSTFNKTRPVTSHAYFTAPADNPLQGAVTIANGASEAPAISLTHDPSQGFGEHLLIIEPATGETANVAINQPVLLRPLIPVTTDYDNADDIELIEGDIGAAASTERTLTLTNAPSNDATVIFTFAGGTANGTNVTEPDINFSIISGGTSLVIDNDGTGGTFVIPADTSAAILAFTANQDSDSTAELFMFTITGIVFGNGVTVTDLPESLTISITDPTPSRLAVSVFPPVISVGETTTVTFALSNIPARVVHPDGDNVVVLRTEFTFRDFPRPSTFTALGGGPPSGDPTPLTFVSNDYDLTISGNVDSWGIGTRDGGSTGELVINTRPPALTDEAAIITLTVTAKAASTLNARSRFARSFGRVNGNDNTTLRHLAVTGNLMFTIALNTGAVYDSITDIAITEGGGDAASAERTLTLTNAPNNDATVSFILTGGTTGVTDADIDFGVSSDASPTINANGMGGTFTIPASEEAAAATLTFTARDNTDSTDERLIFTITGIMFSDGATVAGLNLPQPLNIDITKSVNICGRTEEVHLAIRNAIDSGSPPDCAAITQDQLNTVMRLDLSNTIASTSLRTGDFARLTNLDRLFLNNNTLEELAPDQFSGLTSLTRLDLHNNALTSLDPNLFADLTSLTDLRLFNNVLATLPGNVFANLSELTLLTLHQQRLTPQQVLSLPAGLFGGLNNLQTLRLHNNSRLIGLPAGLFNGLNALETLHLNSNPNLTSLPDGLLDDILDTLTDLLLDARLRRTLGLSVNLNSLVQGGTVIFQLNAVTALEAGLGVRVPYMATFGGGGTTDHFTGLSASGNVDITPGMASATLEVTAPGDAPAGATATVTLGAPSLLYDGNNDNSSDQVKPRDTALPNDPVFNLVRVDTGNDEQTITIILDTRAEYDSTADILIIEDGNADASAERILTLINAPNNDAIVRFTLTGGVADGTAVTDPDITIAVTGGADMLSFNPDGTGGTFRIPTGNLSTTITFAIPTPADADTDAEIITFSITEVDFAGADNDIGPLPDLVIFVSERLCIRTPAVRMAIINAIDPPTLCDDITKTQLSAITGTFNLQSQSLTSLRSDDFTGLTGLNVLFLFSNALAILPASVFSDLTDLMTLNLNGNDLERLEPDLFNGLTNLDSLSLGNNNLIALDPNLFGNVTSLTTLRLDRNSLATLPEDIFAGLTSLLSLDLSQQALDEQQTLSLPAGLFQGLNNMTLLQLDQNPRLTSLDADLFDGLSKLATLHLDRNPGLTSLDADLFDGLSLLRALRLGNNPGLASLDADLFEGLSSLSSLQLNNNPGLTSLDADLFDGLSSLSSLDLENNPGLTSLDADLFEDTGNLGTLRLRNIPGVISLPPGFLDNVLFELGALLLDNRFRRDLNLSVSFNGLVRGREQPLIVRISTGTPMEAGLGVRVPYTAVFGGGGTADDFMGLSTEGTVDILPGAESAEIEVTVASTATLGITATITLGIPSLLYDRNGDDTSDDVKTVSSAVVNDPDLALTNPVLNLVMVDTDNDEQTITVTAPQPVPTAITAISVTNDPVPEGDPIAISITLDQPLPEDGQIQYRISPRSGSSMPIDSNNRDTAVTGASGIADTLRTQTINFLTTLSRIALEDNRVEPDREEGTITIQAIFWGADFSSFPLTENSTVDFSIMDNDAINLTLGIEDNPDIPVTLSSAGEYQVRVRESIGMLNVSIHAEPAPNPPDIRGVVLDRSITASLMSSDNTAIGGTDFIFPGLTAMYSEDNAAHTTFAPVPATIAIHDIDQEKNFTLTLSSDDRAANIDTPYRARVTIVPDTEAHYDNTDSLILVEDGAASAERTLTLLHAPSADATVNFALDGGTVTALNVTDPDISLNVTGGELIGFNSDGMSGNFQIPAGTADVTLVFADNPNAISAGTNIGFTITGITFDDPGTITDIGALGGFNIAITNSAAATAGVGETVGTVSEAAPANTAEVTLQIRNLPGGHGDGTLRLSVPQRAAGNMSLPAADMDDPDYQFRYQVGGLTQVLVPAADFPDLEIMIPLAQTSTDEVDIVITLNAVHDNYDEDETIAINFETLTFPDASVTGLPATVSVPIADDDEVSATLNKAGSPAEHAISPVSGNFILTLARAPDADAEVTYTLEGGLGIKYTADLAGASVGDSLSDTANSIFTIPKDNITGGGPGIEGDAPSTARVTITITPQSDADSDNENVTLTIHSITFDNGSDHGNLAAGDLTGNNISNGAQTLTIMEPLADPTVTYALTTPHAFEPTSNGAGDEVNAVFTLTLSGLDQTRLDADMRQFIFGLIGGTSNTPGFSGSTPGYNPRDPSIASLTIARYNTSLNDYRLMLEYTDMDGANAQVAALTLFGSIQHTDEIPRARPEPSGEEVYTFRVVPQYDPSGLNSNGVEGVESLPFGYRVVFPGTDSDADLKGMVNGGEGDPVPTISDPLVATFTRSDTPTEEGDSPTPATFTLMLENAPSGPAVVTYTLEVSGTTPANDDISAAFSNNITGTPAIGGDGSDTFTINVNITLSSDDTAATLDITPVSDDDADNEIVTLTITGIEVAGLSLGPGNLVCSNCNPDGALIITVMDDDAIPEPPSEIPLRVNGAGDPPEIQLNTAGQANIVVELESGTAAEDIDLAWRVEPKYTDIAAGGDTSCGLTGNSVACWGDTSDGQDTPPAGVRFSSISVGRGFVCGIRLDNELVECWGNSADDRTNPGASANLAAANDLPRTKLIASGRDYTCAVAVEADAAKVSGDSRWYCWGDVSDPPEPDNSYDIDRTFNRPVSAAVFDEISGGRDHICGVRTDAGNEGTLHCTGVGYDFGSQLREFNNESAASLGGTTDPNVRFKKAYAGVAGGDIIQNFSVGTFNSGHYTCVIFEDIDTSSSVPENLEDQAYCWKQDSQQNFNDFEDLIPHDPPTHDGVKSFGHRPSIIQGTKFKSLAAGRYAVCGILLDADPDTVGNQMEDELSCWGEDANNQVTGRPAGRFSKVVSSREHFCAITASGQTECWGESTGGKTSPITSHAYFSAPADDPLQGTVTIANGASEAGPISLTHDPSQGFGEHFLFIEPAAGETANVTISQPVLLQPLIPTAVYDSTANIALTEGGNAAASAGRTLTLANAPNHAATVRFTFAGGTAHVAGVAGVTDPDIAFSVSGGENPVINATGTGGTFTIPANTAAAVLTFTASDSTDSTGEQLIFTVTGIVFGNAGTVPELPRPLTINITDPTPGSLAISVGNPNLEIGDVTTVTLALTNIPTRVSGVEVDRIEFKFRNFPVQTAFSPISGSPTPLTFGDTGAGYDLTISENILGWRIRTIGVTTMGELTINVSPAALTGEAADITLRVTANAVSMLAATNGPARVYGDSNNNLGHPIAITGSFGFTIVDNAPDNATISIDHNDGDEDDEDTTTIAESEDIVVTVTLDQPLPEDGTVHYMILPRAGSTSSIEAHDVTGGFNAPSNASASQGNTTIKFTVGVADDNRIDAAEQEEGTIGIVRVEWGGDGDLLAVNTSVDFTITDNDRVRMSLSDAAPRVRDNAGSLDISLNIVPLPSPANPPGVIVERDISANIATDDDSGGSDPATVVSDYMALNEDYSRAADTDEVETSFDAVPYSIPITQDGDTDEETFTVTLSSDDNAVDIATPEATVTIVPNTTGGYTPAGTIISLTEDDLTPVERTLTLGDPPPNSNATVFFELTGGTAAAQNIADLHALVFTVDGGATGPVIDSGDRSGRFTIPANDSEVTLRFEAGTDLYGDDETITFSITRITFADAGNVTDVTDSILDSLPPNLDITITDVGPTAVVTADNDDTAISELVLDDSAVIRVRLTNIPSEATNAVINFSLTGATLNTDYTVALAGSSAAASSVTITKADIDGSETGVPQGGAAGRAEATLTFLALNDSEAETETIGLTINNVMFAGVSGRDLTGAGIMNNSQSIAIADRPTTTPIAIIRVGEANVTEGDGLSAMPNFRITFLNIDSDSNMGTVNYAFSAGFSAAASANPAACTDTEGTYYCAFSQIASDSRVGLMDQNGSFTFTVSSVSTGSEIGIFILPREDDDAEDETVELTITSITVPQSDGVTLDFNMNSGNLVNPAGNPTNTARITINDDAIRLRIRTFLEGALQ